MAGLLLLEIVMNLGLHSSPSPLMGARRRQAAAVLLANLSLWKEEVDAFVCSSFTLACTYKLHWL